MPQAQVPQEKVVPAEPIKPEHEPEQKEVGEASWYGPGFEDKKTATGETFKQNKMTAASPDLPLGSQAEVTNLENGKKVEVKINDRGPYVQGRAIDLSHAAAKKLGMTEQGTAPVKIVVKPKPKASHKKSGSKPKLANHP